VRIAVLNGPNLNLLGLREPALYGTTTLAEIEAGLVAQGTALGAAVTCVQFNGEGQLVDAVQALRGACDGAIINAGAYSHTSLAIRDAFSAVAVPFVEVHLTNIHAREPERRHSMLASAALAVVVGFGARGYSLALAGLVETLRARGV
jgi:3-dehydroquinate dehydratase-2